MSQYKSLIENIVKAGHSEVYVLARSSEQYIEFGQSLNLLMGRQTPGLFHIASPAHVDFIRSEKPQIIMLKDAWMNPIHDDIVDELQSRGVNMSVGAVASFKLRFD